MIIKTISVIEMTISIIIIVVIITTMIKTTVDVALIISGLVDPSGAVDWRLKGYDKDILFFIIIIVLLGCLDNL